MQIIRFSGWRKNMNKIKFIHLLNEHADISLKDSKEVKDRIVNDEIVEIAVTEDKVSLLMSEAHRFGVIAELGS